mgnify:CR=1 FL=1
MSEIDEQRQDQKVFQEHLERIFKDLEDGVTLTLDEIDDLRYACGLPAIPRKNQFLKEMFMDMGTAFTFDFENIRKESK